MLITRIPAIAAVITCLIFAPEVTATDLHLLWEDRCTQCHGEAGDFAREFLNESDEKLYGSQPNRDVHMFLRSHYLNEQEIDRVYAMLLAQTTSGTRFKDQCGTCHTKAAKLVRDTLVRENGELVIVKSKQSVAAFLQGHGGIQSDDDYAFFLDLLNRIDQEIRGPW